MPDGAQSFLGHASRLLPMNIQAEQSLLGALLSNNPRVIDRCQFLTSFHFADPINGRIFQCAVDRISKGLLADAVTLKTEFENTGVLEDVGGTAYLTQLLSVNMGWMVAGDYAKTIYDAWVRRELIAASDAIMESAYGSDPGADVDKMVDSAAESILTLGEHASQNRGTDYATVAKGAVGRSEAAYQGMAGHARLDTGIASVDRLWGGLWPGQLYYLMARSRTGKTPAMLQITRHVAATLADEAAAKSEPVGHVHLFSLEMTAEDLITVNLASTTRWSADQIKAGEIDDWHGFQQAAEVIGRLPIVIDDQADMDLPGLVMRARAAMRKKRTRLICIDYREMIRRGPEQLRMQLPEWIPFLGYQLKALAKACNVPVIALAQINKSKDSAEDTRPRLGDLPYDGGQAADGVFALHRPELYMSESPPGLSPNLSDEKAANLKDRWNQEREKSRGVAEFHALKRRFGPANAFCTLHFDGPRMLLSEEKPQPPGGPPPRKPEGWDEAHGGGY